MAFNKESTLFMVLAGLAALVMVTATACIYQYNDGVTSLRRQAVDRGCTVTPYGNDYLIDCSKH